MIVITDSNIIFSALKTPNGIVAKILKQKSNIQFFAPDFLIMEVKNHIDKILVNSTKTKREILKELSLLLTEITIIKTVDIPKKNILEAIKIVQDIDIDDTLFVALHTYKKHKIWTGDKVLINGLKAKGFNICVSTQELKTKLYKK